MPGHLGLLGSVSVASQGVNWRHSAFGRYWVDISATIEEVGMQKRHVKKAREIVQVHEFQGVKRL